MLLKRCLIVTVLVMLAVGCTGSYGKLVRQKGTSDDITVEELVKNREDFYVSYGSRDGIRPAALMFDPKDNETALTGDTWIELVDEPSLMETVRAIRLHTGRAAVSLIKGPGDRLFGFMYYPAGLHIPVKVVDETTLYVMALPKPMSAP